MCICAGNPTRCKYERGLAGWKANAATRMTLPILVLCLSTSIYTGAWAGDGVKHVETHQHKSRGSHGTGHRSHARTIHRTLVSRETASEHISEDGVLRTTREDLPSVPQEIHVPIHQDDRAATQHAKSGNEEHVQTDVDLESRHPQPLPKPLAEEDMAEDTGGSSSDALESPLPNSELFHIPDRFQELTLPTEGFVYVYDLPTRWPPFT